MIAPLETDMAFLLAVGVALLVLLAVPLARRFIFKLFNLIPAALMLMVGIGALIFARPIAWTVNRVPFLAWLCGLFARGVARLGKRQAGLAAGDRMAIAREFWPEERFPYLYSDVPDDIRRPLWEDGKLIGGRDIAWMADRHFGAGMTEAAARLGLTAALIGLIVQVVLFLYWQPSGLSVPPTVEVLLEQFPGEEPVYVTGWMVWHVVALDTWLSFFRMTSGVLAHALSWLLVSLGVGVLVAIAAVEHWRKRASAPYERISKDAHVRWPHRAEIRALAHTGYLRQIAHATGYLHGSPLFKIGEGTGTFRLRGDLAAPTAGQTIALDRESLFQHMLVFGGTGDGKTTAILKPLLRQVLAQPHFGAYITDAKGVLWRDAEEIAAAVGRSGDTLRIGTGPDEMGVNVTAKLSPNQIAATMRSVLTQMGGGEGDSFWPDMAANVMRHMLTIGRAYAATPEGEAAAKTLSPYSLWWAYQAVLDEARLQPALDAIGRAIKDQLARMDAATAEGDSKAYAAEAARTRLLAGADVVASHAYLTEAWKVMASDTRTGIIANISQLMDGFAGTPVLRERFVSGLEVNTASLDAPLNGKIALVTLNTMDDGLPARLVAILLKTVLYREARLREATAKAKGENPQEKPCLVMMDEVQELATVDPTTGLSDATFWNVARSTGLAGVFATQTIAALTQAMGRDAADNFIQQARSKIFLRSEDRATVSYACWLAGEFERNRVYGDGQWESLDQRRLVSGWSPFEPVDDNAMPADIEGWRFYFEAARGFFDGALIGTATPQPAYAEDARFIPKASDQATGLAALSAKQQAAWRQEDQDRRYRTEGNAMAPAMTPADFIAMGRWHAYAHVQRAGLARQDVVVLRHQPNTYSDEFKG